ncbi:selenide, water dikinase SelD [Bartonella sp. HY329]|uniref:selenide, water dikinase SelD n=1 Tax=unclassified Bartonella TaxID=2645622 RepID=UPI0021C7121C|nr:MULTISPECIES: selenide, water dikinase SelD [unclassified Bartonella]UXM95278.1 selenide, water dikinase SelD [Bartonella sp. HY329]UXN09602.1 selenide, water dikinase SelD [Bartonella sp. HY328]
MSDQALSLTKLAHGGGCGCKLAPAVLQKMLVNQPKFGPFNGLVVGNEASDDAAVYALDDNNLIIATTDFFMPMVDDPIMFGRIAGANAISDIYAMGGRPLMALAILGMPIDKLSPHSIAKILQGGQEIAAEAGIAVAGGHSIDCPEPVYGLAVIGSATPKTLRRNDTARAGDTLLLLKGLGVGIYSAAFKKAALSDSNYNEMVQSMTKLNTIGMELAKMDSVHAMTDVTGFGILGHALEMARGSNFELRLHFDRLPFLSDALKLANEGYITGASKRNFDSYGDAIRFEKALSDHQKALLTDPQTSGGLLIAVAPENAKDVMALALSSGYERASIIGEVVEGKPQIVVL